MKTLSEQINIRISKEEKDMINILNKPPYNINISDFLRASIRNIYRVRTNKNSKNAVSKASEFTEIKNEDK